MKFEWEEIDNNYETVDSAGVYITTYRSKVLGGWLVKHDLFHSNGCNNTKDEWDNAYSQLVFIPDDKHEWTIY